MIKPLELITISKEFSQTFITKPIKVRLFNFAQGVLIFDLKNTSKQQLMGSYEMSWIRVYDEFDKYYDFLASSVFFVWNQKGLMMMCSEDLQYIDIKYISHLIRQYVDKYPNEAKVVLASDMLNVYYQSIEYELRIANRNLWKIYNQAGYSDQGRLDIEDSYELARGQLVRHYLLDLMIKRIIRENRSLLQQELG